MTYGYPLYDTPLSTSPMGFPPPDDGRGPTVAETLAAVKKKTPPK